MAEVVLITYFGDELTREEKRMELEWVIVSEFPNYLVSNNGDIVNAKSGRWMAQSLTQEGVPKVGLVNGTKQYTRSVATVVARAFVHGADDICDTVVHLDGDLRNNNARNLVWRPRWFACQYADEFRAPSDNAHIGPIRCVDTGARYVDIYEAAITDGLLMSQIRRSIVMGEPVFPTFQRFEMV